MQKLKIDKELENYLPRHSAEERERLKRQLERDGCLDPLRIWAGKNIVIDGMERHSICEEIGIKYKTIEIDGLKTREDVKDWMSENQVGRRNLEGQQWQYHIGRVYNKHKGERGGDKKSDAAPESKNVAAEIAEKEGVSEKTVIRAGKLADLVDEAAEKAPEIRDAILNEGVSVPTKKLKEIAKAPKRKAKQLAAAAIEGEPSPEPEPEPAEPERVAYDSAGKKITDPRYVAAFVDREEFDSLLRQARSFQADIKRLAQSAGGFHIDAEECVARMKFVVDELKSRKPAAICKTCKGEKTTLGDKGKRVQCATCSGAGFVDEFRRSRLKDKAA